MSFYQLCHRLIDTYIKIKYILIFYKKNHWLKRSAGRLKNVAATSKDQEERRLFIHDGAGEGSYVGANAGANEGAGAGAADEGIPGWPMATHALLHFFSHWFSDTKTNGMHCLIQSP